MDTDIWRNFKTILVFMRFDIKNDKNAQVAGIIIDVIKNNSTFAQMKKMVTNVMPEWNNQLIAKNSKEKSINNKKEEVLFFIKAMELLKNSFMLHDYEMAYDLADMLHAFPDIVISGQKNSLKNYWRIYVRPVQKKWKLQELNAYRYISDKSLLFGRLWKRF